LNKFSDEQFIQRKTLRNGGKMGVLRFNYHSEVLGMYTDITVTYPTGRYTCGVTDGSESGLPGSGVKKRAYVPGMKLPTVYMLHGGGEDDTVFQRMSRLEYYAEQNGVMTVTPQVNDSFFLDTRYGIRYFTYLTEELPVLIRSLFASSGAREDNYVVGMAMGGNGALQLAMRRPDLYAACVDLSGGIGCTIDTDNLVSQLNSIGHLPKFQGAFGEAAGIPGSEYDLAVYAKRNKEEGIEVPQLFLAVGKEDFIRDVVRKDRDALLRLGYQITYEEPEGYAHDWDFWDVYLKKTFDEWLPITGRRKGGSAE